MYQIKISSKDFKRFEDKNNYHLNFNIFNFLNDKIDLSKKQFNNLINNDSIYINDKIYTNKQKNILKPNDILSLNFMYPEDNSNILNSKNIDNTLEIIYEDEYILVFNKTKPYPVMQVKGHMQDTYSNIIKDYFDSIGLKKKIRFVNRLDRLTTRICIVAKCSYVHEQLTKTINDKKYHMITTPVKYTNSFIIEKEISTQKNTNKRTTTPNLSSKYAKTIFTVLKTTKDFSYLVATLKTGRCHQIRCHLESNNIYIINDDLYIPKTQEELTNYFNTKTFLKKNNFLLDTLFLHSSEVDFYLFNKHFHFENLPFWNDILY